MKKGEEERQKTEEKKKESFARKASKGNQCNKF